MPAPDHASVTATSTERNPFACMSWPTVSIVIPAPLHMNLNSPISAFCLRLSLPLDAACSWARPTLRTSVDGAVFLPRDVDRLFFTPYAVRGTASGGWNNDQRRGRARRGPSAPPRAGRPLLRASRRSYPARADRRRLVGAGGDAWPRSDANGARRVCDARGQAYLSRAPAERAAADARAGRERRGVRNADPPLSRGRLYGPRARRDRSVGAASTVRPRAGTADRQADRGGTVLERAWGRRAGPL